MFSLLINSQKNQWEFISFDHNSHTQKITFISRIFLSHFIHQIPCIIRWSYVTWNFAGSTYMGDNSSSSNRSFSIVAGEGTYSMSSDTHTIPTIVSVWVIPVSYGFLLPMFVETIVSEKEAKAVEMMKIVRSFIEVSWNYLGIFTIF